MVVGGVSVEPIVVGNKHGVRNTRARTRADMDVNVSTGGNYQLGHRERLLIFYADVKTASKKRRVLVAFKTVSPRIHRRTDL